MELDREFIRNAFGRLAGSDFSDVEMALLFYFFSKGSSCFDTFLVKPSEISAHTKRDKKAVLEAIFFLGKRKVLKIKESSTWKTSFKKGSLGLSVNCDFSSWLLPKELACEKKSSVEDVKSSIESVSSINLISSRHFSSDNNAQAKLIADFYAGAKALPSENLEEVVQEALVLVKKYSFDAVLFMLKHFSEQIESLSDLLNKWEDYQKDLQARLTKIDFSEAKKQHDNDDHTLREIAKKCLSLAQKENLSSEEVRLLEIIIENDHPRRQLFWAYRVRENYPNLEAFFTDNFKLMLPVTTRGKILRKKPLK